MLTGLLSGREQLDVTCEKPLEGQKSVDMTGCNRSLFVYKAGQSLGNYDSKNNDTDADRLVRYLQVRTTEATRMWCSAMR